MSKRLLMLGAGFMQGVAIDAAHHRNWHVTAVDGNPEAVYRSRADRFDVIDLKDTDSLVSYALRLQKTEGLDAVFTAATDFSFAVASIAHACGLPGHSVQAALNATDKERMRACFSSAGVPSPAWTVVDERSCSTALSKLTDIGLDWPVVVKPVDNMGARGCRMVLKPLDLDEAVSDAITWSRSGRAIIEAYMDGPEFSLEALVYDGKIVMTGVADRHIRFPPWFIEMGHTLPSKVSETVRGELVGIFEQGIRALGLTHGVAKGDIKLTATGPMVGEIAGRLSGGYMSGWTFPFATGIDLTNCALTLAVGERPATVRNSRTYVSAERAWISVPGQITQMYGLDEARSEPHIKEVFPRHGVGDTTVFPRNNVEKSGNVLSCAPSHTEAVYAAEQAVRRIVLRLAPGNPKTEAFLFGEFRNTDSFPPPVFNLSPAHPTCGNQLVYPGEEGEVNLWHGGTLAEALKHACTVESGLESALSTATPDLLARYRMALIHGGIQGILYVYDSNL